MIDPIVSLAFAVYSNKGAYALLLGSGISRASGIPTGWEVVLDLIRKLAKLEGEDCGADAADWFRKKHGTEPSYSKLLAGIAKTQAERQQLLRGYFEPTEDERSQGIKLPSTAHKAIAQLVAAGHLRVILTTNFDRLMEKALEEVGIAPTVISTTDQLLGALPLAHSGATVIKLHGDYLDTRLKNTDLELAGYDKALDGMLDRIFDEYGLIVSGWSGDWDIALRAAIERSSSRRFSTFWATRSPLSETGKRMVEHRQATLVQIKDADQFFVSLQEKIQALCDLAAPHPLSARMAGAMVKRYIVDPSAMIRLRDLVHEETEKLFVEINAPYFGGRPHLPEVEELISRVEKYEALSKTLVSMLVLGAYWGDDTTIGLWVAALQRIATLPSVDGFVYLSKLRRYPALLLFYCVGIAATAGKKYKTLAIVLTDSRARNEQNQPESFCSVVIPLAVNEHNIWRMVPSVKDHYTPVSDRLFETLRGPFRELLPDDNEYADTFDRFEYLLGLVHAYINRGRHRYEWWGPVGRFAWRGNLMQQEARIGYRIGAEIAAEADNWPLLKAGLFKGSREELSAAKAKFDDFLRSVHFH